MAIEYKQFAVSQEICCSEILSLYQYFLGYSDTKMRLLFGIFVAHANGSKNSNHELYCVSYCLLS